MAVASRYPGYLLGYHGTDSETARKAVLGELRLEPSTNVYDWLGKGIYFWEGSRQRAYEWALQEHPDDPAVLGGVISLGHCLDLLEQECLDYVHETYQALKADAEQRKIELPVNGGKRRELDCAIINAAVRGHEPAYDSVRAAFQEGKALAKSSGIHQRSHIQIAVHNPNCIKGYFYPQDGDLRHREV